MYNTSVLNICRGKTPDLLNILLKCLNQAMVPIPVMNAVMYIPHLGAITTEKREKAGLGKAP